jgi:hypothetical protein
MSHLETGVEMAIYYFAAWTDSNCLLGCSHEHSTVLSAAACISQAGGYVVAVENGALRALTEVEEIDFQHAMYGTNTERLTTQVMIPLRLVGYIKI